MAGNCLSWLHGCCSSGRPARPGSPWLSWHAGSACSARANGSSCSLKARPRLGSPQRHPRLPGVAVLLCPADGSAEDVRRRADRAAALTHMGELSAAAQALTASPLAPATSATLAALRDPERRPPTVQVPLDPPLDPRSSSVVEICTRRLLANLRRTRRGAAAGPSGCTNEHLRVLLDEESCTQLLGRVAARLAVAEVPGEIAGALRLGRMVALTKPAGGVRALVMGDVFRRLVARTLAQQFGEQFRQACAPRSARAQARRRWSGRYGLQRKPALEQRY